MCRDGGDDGGGDGGGGGDRGDSDARRLKWKNFITGRRFLHHVLCVRT